MDRFEANDRNADTQPVVPQPVPQESGAQEAAQEAQEDAAMLDELFDIEGTDAREEDVAPTQIIAPAADTVPSPDEDAKMDVDQTMADLFGDNDDEAGEVVQGEPAATQPVEQPDGEKMSPKVEEKDDDAELNNLFDEFDN